MGFFDKAKCFTGFHDWSSWKPTDKCDQSRSCLRADCGVRQSRTEHAWAEYRYVEDRSCLQHRNCTRCPATSQQTAPHTWTQWEYLRPQDCRQHRHCERCPEEEQRVQHVWTDVWQYASPRSCHQVLLCRRCPEERKERAPASSDHRWGEPERVDCTHVKATCTRCAEDKVETRSTLQAEHVFGQPVEMPTGRWRWRCRQCAHFGVGVQFVLKVQFKNPIKSTSPSYIFMTLFESLLFVEEMTLFNSGGRSSPGIRPLFR